MGKRLGPTALERDIQAQVVATYRACGLTAWNLSQGYRPGGARHGTTRQSKGLPDLILTHPARGLLLVHETKRPGGRQTLEQKTFQLHCQRAGVAYVLGGVDEAIEHLRMVGLVV